ncbi:MAG: hypothetical protein Q4F83_03020 [Eubacteriales bacterium]|nr:hypothetical protein [Eubacteriales bacterium]
MDGKVIFQDNGSGISIQSLYCIGGYITYEVSSWTCGFSGICNFCIEENKLKEYIKMIDSMIKILGGELEIRDCESDAYLKIYFEDSMNFYVSGQIGGSYEDNILRFKLKADQTLLYGLKRNLLDY